ncbi:tetratricopeptide repeat protein [Moheibacter sp.]|uniref:tetratricopeptide repeat protein n=1 Tax=Moheibacter sp. TaxID=1965316 RepID=UPI003C78F54C
MFKFRKVYWIFWMLIIGCQSKEQKPTLSKSDVESEQYNFPVPEKDADIDDLNNYATSQWGKGNYKEALNYFSIAYQKAKDEKDETRIANILNNTGLVHWRLGDNLAAMESYRESNRLAQKLGLKRLTGLTYTNISLIQKEESDFENAIENNTKAIKIFQELNSRRDLAIAYNNHGQIFKNQYKNDSALTNYLKAIQIYNHIDYKDGMAATYYNLAEIYTRQQEKQKAVIAADKSLESGLESQSKVRISEAYRKLAETYEFFSEADSALKYHKKYAEFEKEILVANQSEKLIEEQAKLGNEVKNLRIQNLEKEKIIAQNRLWFILISILIILLILSLIVYRRISLIQMKEKELALELENSQKILSVKKKELRNYIVDLSQKNQLINELQQKKSFESDKNEIQVAQLLNQKILTDEDWEKFKEKFSGIYPEFLPKLIMLKTSLTEAEIRLLVLLRLKLSGKEMASTLGISPQSVRVTKMRLKKKLQEENYESVEDFLAEL